MRNFSRGLHDLPRFSDGWTFVYADKCHIEREHNGLALKNVHESIQLPVAPLSVLMMGPGSTITHAAVALAGESACTLLWCGDGATRFYACGAADPRRANNLYHQAEAWADPARRMEIVRRMYEMRFPEPLPRELTIEQVRGHEGVRVRTAYAQMAKETGVEWRGRRYDRNDWGAADAINKAISAANSCLHSLVHAAVVATGFSTGLGFIHTGKLLAFVFDVADLYKIDVTVPIAFRAVLAGGEPKIEARTRRFTRAALHRLRLVEKIVPDIQFALGMRVDRTAYIAEPPVELEEEEVAQLWDPGLGPVPGGVSYAHHDEELPF